ncbi:MAG: glutamate-5-semialdehyde dehydrogenase [Spirochaetes bacterium]|nr:glutamate-5-semialdehyde dehydrogenase [Spirochaetota bacterium]
MGEVMALCRAAKDASARLLGTRGEVRSAVLRSVAQALRAQATEILRENDRDVEAARVGGENAAFIDRLTLNPKRIEDMARGVEEIALQPDPVGEVAWSTVRPDGLSIRQERVPIGVVCVIFESRPNVVTDIAALCLKSGNAAILRGGKEAFHSNQILGRIVSGAIAQGGLPPACVQVLASTDRALMDELLKQKDHIDMVVPRGGEGLIRHVTEHSLIPVVKHDKGVCHTYIDANADGDMAVAVSVNAKVQRPGTCNALETLLIHREFPQARRVLEALHKAGVEIRGDADIQALAPFVKPASDADWDTEYLDLILSAKQVGDLDEAIEFIRAHGTGHSEAILTRDYENARRFRQRVDAACVFTNASTRLADGSVFGLGAEVGISTQKLHARGPMGARDLTCLKYIIEGSGQIRT